MLVTTGGKDCLGNQTEILWAQLTTIVKLSGKILNILKTRVVELSGVNFYCSYYFS